VFWFDLVFAADVDTMICGLPFSLILRLAGFGHQGEVSKFAVHDVVGRLPKAVPPGPENPQRTSRSSFWS
jgi:hypothetical protein